MTGPQMPGYDASALMDAAMASALVEALRAPTQQLEVTQTEVMLGPAWEKPGHPVPNIELDADQLQADFAQALGRDVAVVARAATETTTGVLHVLDAKTGHQLTVAPDVVAAVLEAHTPPEAEEDTFAREYDDAPDDAGRLAAYRAHVGRQRDERDRERFLAQRMRQRLSEAAPRLSGPAAAQPPRPQVPPPVTSRNPWNRPNRGRPS